MYSVYGDGICIYNDLCLAGAVNALTPKLNLADNTAGTLEITLPVGNAGYDKLERLSSEIVVKRDNEEIWAGRIISEKKNFQNSRILTCEGELAYFNDTTQPPTEYNDVYVYDFLDAILYEHNSKVAEDKQVEIGSITVGNDTISRITNNETTMEAISDHLIDKLGGHIRIRRVYDEEGTIHRYLDYLADYPNTNGQTIRFEQNLLDFTRNWDMSEYATVIMPRGAKLDTSPIESVDAYLDVSSVNGGSRYVTNEDAIKMYGWIELVVDWEDITDPSELLQKAKDYLADEQFDDVIIEVSAVDLRYLSKDVQSINLLDNVRCISRPHGMDKVFPVTQLSIQLDSAENSTYTLGDTVKENSLTASTRAANTAILERIAKIPNEKTILDKAQDNATSIMNMATQGYVTIVKNQNGSEYLAVSSENANTAYNPTSGTWKSGTKLWKWSINGLGYSKDGGKNFGTAITMDGAIVANYITTGTMSADRIRTGILQDEKGNTNWNLSTGVLTMKKGSITLGVSTSYPSGRFSVDDYGYLTAEYGKIGGFKITATSIYNDTIRLNNYGIQFTAVIDDTYTTLGRFSINNHVENPDARGINMNIEHSEYPRYTNWGYRDNATDKFYTMKFTYFNKAPTSDWKVPNDSLVLGTQLYLNQCRLIDRNQRTLYESFSLTYDDGSGNKYAEPIRLYYDLVIKKDGTIRDYSYIDLYIINGIIMDQANE